MKIIAFDRWNRLPQCEKQLQISGMKYYQAYHDCLYMYESWDEVKYKDDTVCELDENGVLVKVPLPPIQIQEIQEITLEEYAEMEEQLRNNPGMHIDEMTPDELRRFCEYEAAAQEQERRHELGLDT